MPIEVIGDEVTLHKDVRTLTDGEGNVTGSQLGLGKTYLKGEVVPDSEVGQVYFDILDNEDDESHESLSKLIKKSSGEARQNTAQRLGVPFEGYDDMEEDEIVAAMKHLPSALIQAIKVYEEEHGEGRDKIVHYIIGFGSDPDARQEGRVGSDVLEDDDRTVAAEDKATAKLTTRSVPGVDEDADDEGAVQHGEGFTGTGEGARPYGSESEDDNGDGESKPKKVVRNRRGRRDRQTSASTQKEATPGTGEGSQS